MVALVENGKIKYEFGGPDKISKDEAKAIYVTKVDEMLEKYGTGTWYTIEIHAIRPR